MEEADDPGGRPAAASNKLDDMPKQMQSVTRTEDGNITMHALQSDSASDVSMATDSDDGQTTGEQQQYQHSGGIQQYSAKDSVSRKRKSPDTDINNRPSAQDPVSGKTKKVKVGGANQSTIQLVSRSGIPEDRSLLPSEVWRRIFSLCPPKTLGNLLRVNKLFKSFLDPSSPVPPASNLKPNAIWQGARRLFWPQMPTPLRGKTELDMWCLACSRTCQFCGKKEIRAATALSEPVRFGLTSGGVACIWTFQAVCCAECFSKNSVKEMDLLMSDFPTFLMPALTFVFSTSDGQIVPPSAIERGQVPQPSTLTKLFWSLDVDSMRQEFLSVKELGASAVEEWLKGLPSRGTEQKADAAKWEKYEDSGGVVQMRTLLYPGYQPTTAIPPAPVSVQHRPRAEYESTQSPSATLPPAASLPQLSPAAVQATSPLDDARNLLKPRLLPQGGKTEDRSELDSPVFIQPKSSVQQDPGRSKTKEELDSEWDEIQGPVRLKILKYADEAIIGDWDDGEKVTKDNAPSFAVDVLLHVRKRFYVEVEKDAAAARDSGKAPIVDPPKGPFTQKLTLENMKYVFDVKIRPLTEPLRKEIFLCNGCGFSAKFFGFEGVIQHYAAKHTTGLSMGNIVVYWRAEWPAVPPFKPNPKASKNSFHPLPAIPPAPSGQEMSGSRNNHSSLPSDQLHSAPQLPQIPPQPQQYPGGTQDQYGRHGYANEYQQLPPSPYPAVDQYSPNQPQYGQQAYPSQSQPMPYQPYPSNSPGGYQPSPMGAVSQASPLQPPPGPKNYSYDYGNFIQPAAYVDGPQSVQYPQAPPAPIYQEKLEGMARHARELWMTTSNMVDLPGVVRIYTIIRHLYAFHRSRYQESLDLGLFIDGLSNHKDMRPVRNVNELPCKACYLGLGTMSFATEDRKVFSLPQLVNHFRSSHEGQARANTPYGQPALVWITDMLLLPYPSALEDMLGGHGQFPLFEEAMRMANDDSYPTEIENNSGGGRNQTEPDVSVDNHNRFNGNAALSDQAPHNHQHHRQEKQQYQGDTAQNHNSTGHSAFGAGESSDRSQNSSAADQRSWQKGSSDYNHSKPQKNRPGKEKKKNGQKGRHGNTHKYGSGESSGAKRKEEEAIEKETKQAEEEERKREGEIRAMWAADRTQATQIQPTPELANANSPQTVKSAPDSAHGPSHTDTPVIPQKRKPRTPHQPERQKPPPPPSRSQISIKQEENEDVDMQDVQKAPEKEPPRALVRETAPEPDLLGALEMHLSHAQDRSPAPPTPLQAQSLPASASRAAPLPSAPPARVIYVDERGREVMPPREPERHVRYEPEQGHLRSSAYVRYEDAPPPAHSMQQAGLYRERSPPQPYAGEPVYETQHGSRRYVSDGVRSPYDRTAPPPPPPHSYTQTVPPPRREYYRVYADDARPTQPVEYESYELVRVVHPDGDYYVRRPVRREPAPVARPEVDPPGSRYYEYAAPGPAYEDVPASSGRSVRREAEVPPLAPYMVAGFDPAGYERYGGSRSGPVGAHPGGRDVREIRDIREMPGQARPEQGYYEEYDPRYPSATTGQDGRRQARYQ